MRRHDKSENESAMSKMAAEHRHVNGPPQALPMLRQPMGCSTQLQLDLRFGPLGPRSAGGRNATPARSGGSGP